MALAMSEWVCRVSETVSHENLPTWIPDEPSTSLLTMVGALLRALLHLFNTSQTVSVVVATLKTCVNEAHETKNFGVRTISLSELFLSRRP
jgi:hypothetical protein